MSEEKEVKNPNMYGYKHDQDATVKGGVLNEMMRLVEPMLEKESQVYFPRIVGWYTKEGKPVEGNPTEKEAEEKQLVRNLELDKILNNKEPQVYYTPIGLELLRLQVMLFETKSGHIDDGTAQTVEDLREATKMGVVK